MRILTLNKDAMARPASEDMQNIYGGKMKRCILFAFLVMVWALSSCTKDLQQSVDYQSPLDCNNAQKEFAVILSKAVTDNQDLRIFLKNEACSMVDNDYDVFYPWTKNKIVVGEKTFRDILLQYCESESSLAAIEKSLPLLTILIPDLSFISEAFSNPEKWDVTNPDVLVTYRNGNEKQEVLSNGHTAFCVGPNELFDGTVLVVKNNERIVASLSTKGESEPEYSFLDEVFDNTQSSTKAASWVYDYFTYDTSDYSDFESASNLNNYYPDVIKSYNECQNSTTGILQRDFCYYGMTKNNATGNLKTNVREGLYRFRFMSASSLAAVCDDKNFDPTYSTSAAYDYEDKGAGKPLFGIMADGKLEIWIEYFYGVVNSGATTKTMAFDIYPKDVLQVSSLKRGFQHKTLFHGRHWTYEVAFLPKWYYPPMPVTFFTWDLRQYSTELNLSIWEKDSGSTYSTTDEKSITWQFSSSFSKDGKKNKYGVNASYNNNNVSKISCSYSEKDDNLGWITIAYGDNLIKGTKNGGYVLNQYTGGNKFVLSVVPYAM